MAAITAVLQSGLALPSRIAMIASLLTSCWLCWRHEAGKAGLVVREQPGGWWIDVAGRAGGADLRRVQVWRYLVVMDFRVSDGDRHWRQHVVVLPDALPKDEFRRLCVRLRHDLHMSGRKRPTTDSP